MSDFGNLAIMSENIRYYMDQNGKTRMQVCNELGVKYTTFVDWEKGKKYPRIDKIEMLAKYFGVEKRDLVERKGSHPCECSEEERAMLNLYAAASDDDKAVIQMILKKYEGR